jgi:hypothetical protein
MAAQTSPATPGVSTRAGYCHETHFYDGRYHRIPHLVCNHHSDRRGDRGFGGRSMDGDNGRMGEHRHSDAGTASGNLGRHSDAGTAPSDKPGASTPGVGAPTPR